MPNGCVKRHNTSETARNFNCLYATNGGFFDFAGKCLGNVIINGSRVDSATQPWSNFGITRNNEVVIGYVEANDIARFQFEQLIQGAGWLVRDGQSYVAKARDLNISSSFVKIKAPRTSIATLREGQVVLFQTDGIESTKEGLDLIELAEVLVEFGALHAMNIDGGGSSVSVYQGRVIDRPTCKDTPEPICERAVTTITCIRQPPVHKDKKANGLSRPSHRAPHAPRSHDRS